jgi:hypothetical protein
MATTPKKAKYHSPDGTTPIYDVLKENADKTLDLGDAAEETLIIGKCTVSEDGKIGTCTLDVKEDEKAEAKSGASPKAEQDDEKAEPKGGASHHR